MKRLHTFNKNSVRRISDTVFSQEHSPRANLANSPFRKSGSHGKTVRDLYPVRFFNNSGEEIPPYAIMRIVSTSSRLEREYLVVGKPNGTPGIHLVNGGTRVEDQAEGHGTYGLNGCIFLYDDSDDPIIAGESFGAKADEWAAFKGYGGFLNYGRPFDANSDDVAMGVQVYSHNYLHELFDGSSYTAAGSLVSPYTDQPSWLYFGDSNCLDGVSNLANHTELIQTADPYDDGCLKFTRAGYYKLSLNLTFEARCVNSLFTSTATTTDSGHSHNYDKVNLASLNGMRLSVVADTDTPSGSPPTSLHGLHQACLTYSSGFVVHTIYCEWCEEVAENALLRIKMQIDDSEYLVESDTTWLLAEYLRDDMDTV